MYLRILHRLLTFAFINSPDLRQPRLLDGPLLRVEDVERGQPGDEEQRAEAAGGGEGGGGGGQADGAHDAWGGSAELERIKEVSSTILVYIFKSKCSRKLIM